MANMLGGTNYRRTGYLEYIDYMPELDQQHKKSADILAQLGLTQVAGLAAAPSLSPSSSAVMSQGDARHWHGGSADEIAAAVSRNSQPRMYGRHGYESASEQLVLSSRPQWSGQGCTETVIPQFDAAARAAAPSIFRFNADAVPFRSSSAQLKASDDSAFHFQAQAATSPHVMPRPWRAGIGQEALLSTPAFPNWHAAAPTAPPMPAVQGSAKATATSTSMSELLLLPQQIAARQQQQHHRVEHERFQMEQMHLLQQAALSPESLQLEATAFSVALTALDSLTPPVSPALRPLAEPSQHC